MNDYPDRNEYSSFDNALRRKRPGLLTAILGPVLVSKFRSPIFATLALLVAGAIFAGIMMASYPGDVDESQVPVIRAEEMAYKRAPETAGGMDVPHTDSTIFQAMRGGDDRPKVENLLAQVQREEPVEDVQELMEEVETLDTRVEEEVKDVIQATEALNEKIEEVQEKVTEITDVVQKPVSPPEKVAEKAVEKIIEKPAEKPAEKPSEKLKALHPAGSSPETIEFVRSVLEEKKETPVKAKAPAPKVTAKTSSGAVVIAKGNHYVQLASVKDAARASSEWGNLQKKYPVLKPLQYRVQRADLGAKGVFYRIQAGGLSQASAGLVCKKIKEKTAGGCFVTK